jgi:pimeloyl-ACP methyl ester carboxylesterase
MEKQLFFKSGGLNLYGMLYSPKQSIVRNKGYLIIHSIAEEKKCSQRTLVELAMELSSKGFFVFMFDLRGCADSQGEFKDATITSWIEDINNATVIFKKETAIDDISFIGLRFGAYLAMVYNITHSQIANLILIEPIFSPYDFLRKSLKHKFIREFCTDGVISSKKSNVLEQLERNSVDFDGFEITPTFFNDINLFREKYDSYTLIEHVRGLIINITLTGKISRETVGLTEKNNVLKHQTLKMDFFWDKIDECDTRKLNEEVINYCLDHDE